MFRAADTPPDNAKSRSLALDGIRGFASFGVFLHHAVIARGYLAGGVWELPPSRFFSMAGQVGVAVFFIITGFLFGGMLIRERGRPRWPAVYVGRVFRIGPIYWVAVGAMVVISLAKYGVPPQNGWPSFASDVFRWMSLGLLVGGGLDGRVDLGTLGEGVIWTLRYEWTFYAALPILALGTSSPLRALIMVATLGLVGLLWWAQGAPLLLGSFDPVLALLFVTGLGCAALEANGLTLHWPNSVMSMLAYALVLTEFLVFPQAYGLAAIAPLAGAFFIVVSGATLFGLLTARPARRLGDISFGIYMLQGPILTLVFWPSTVTHFALSSGIAFWTVIGLASVSLVVTATLAHRWIERPGIQAGRDIIARFDPDNRRIH